MTTYCVLDSNLNVVNVIIATSNYTIPGYTLIQNSNAQIGQQFSYSNGLYIAPSNLFTNLPFVPINQTFSGNLIDTLTFSNITGYYYPSSNTHSIRLEILGGGGGGGGGSGSTSNCGAGGGAGGYAVALVSNISSSNIYLYNIGLGGLGNTTAGSPGTSTNFIANSNYLVTGGLGGGLGVNSETISAQGGAGGSSSNSSLFIYTLNGQPGGPGIKYTNTTGSGGNSQYGIGGISVFNGGNSAGSNGIGFGSGGSGGSGSGVGGKGSGGLIVITEYS